MAQSAGLASGTASDTYKQGRPQHGNWQHADPVRVLQVDKLITSKDESCYLFKKESNCFEKHMYTCNKYIWCEMIHEVFSGTEAQIIIFLIYTN